MQLGRQAGTNNQIQSEIPPRISFMLFILKQHFFDDILNFPFEMPANRYAMRGNLYQVSPERAVLGKGSNVGFMHPASRKALKKNVELLHLETGWIWLVQEDNKTVYLAASFNLPPALSLG
jgi:hypothetical protein